MTRARIIGLVILGALSVPRRGNAQMAVVDAGNIAQSILTAANTAKAAANTLAQLEQTKLQVQYQLQAVQSIDPRSFNGVLALIDQSNLTYAMIRGDVSSLGFTVQEVNRDFDGLFPRDKTNWQSVKYSDYDTYYTRWNSEITASSKSADRAQASIEFVENNNRAIADILAKAQVATGEVRQLQLINQQLALIHQELGALVQNLATAGRVNANMAAAAAGEKMLTREAKLRRRDGYTSLGRPAQTLQHLP